MDGTPRIIVIKVKLKFFHSPFAAGEIHWRNFELIHKSFGMDITDDIFILDFVSQPQIVRAMKSH